MHITALHHVNIVVDDADAATHFYGTVLGLPVIDDRPATAGPGGHFALGASELHLTVGSPLESRGQHIAIVVDDLAATIAELTAAGADVDVPEDPGARRTFARDPAGNRLEILRLPD